MTFFLDRIPLALKKSGEDPQASYLSFLKLLDLYSTGVLSIHEFISVVLDLKITSGAQAQEADEIFLHLEKLIVGRENSRKVNNMMLKPLSEIDLSQFTREDHVSYSYYRLQDDYSNPICTGRLLDPVCAQVLNEKYCSVTTGSENFKFKQKYEYEDNLFRTEDTMYGYDHELYQLSAVLAKLRKEKANGVLWEAQDPNERSMYQIKHLSRVALDIIKSQYDKLPDARNFDCIEKITESPVLVLDVFINRIEKQHAAI